MFPNEKLYQLKDNWDGQGARAPTTEEINEARDIWGELRGFGWQVVPISTGGIQIERHCDGLHVEIQVVMSDEALAKKGRM